MISRGRVFAGLSGLLLAGTGLSANAQGLSGLVPHRAVYNLELADASERSGISSMFGRMVYEFTGSPCDGYRVNFRFVTQVDASGEKKVTDQQSTTFEDFKNGRFEFESKTFNNEQLAKDVSGLAEKHGGKLDVELSSPVEKQLSLTAARFPTQHTLDVINRAEKGEHFFETKVFDGSDNGDKTLITSTVMGSPVDPTAADTDAANAGKLKLEKTWPVTIAYFDDAAGTDGIPTYSMSFKLYANGVSRDLLMDYGDFSLKGSLVKLDFLPVSACPGG
jgi:hypothetical protein